MARPHPLLESGDGAPSLRPLYMLMPYLWPKGRPDLKLRVVVSLLCLVLAILATTIGPIMFGWIIDAANPRRGVANILLATTFGLIAGYVAARILMQAFAQLRGYR